MIDVGRKFVSHKIDGSLASTVASYLQHFNLQHRQIWLTRNGECSIDVVGKRGVDPGLSSFGFRYSRALANFIDLQRNSWKPALNFNDSLSSDAPFVRTRCVTTNLRRETSNQDLKPEKGFGIWTSMMQRSIQTAHFFDRSRYKAKHTRLLDDVGAGVLEEPTYDNIQNIKCPRTRMETYVDAINRANAVLLEVERTTDHVLLIAHHHLVATLLAYFQGLEKAQSGVPLGTLYVVEPVSIHAKEFGLHQFCN
jgi:6-phosphofructo-2-kinase